MKKLLIFFIFWTILANANIIETYTNSRFSFSIDYPYDIFINKSFPDNGDGVWLTNKSKTAKLTPSGSYMTVSENIEEEYKQQTKWKKENKEIELTYKAQKDNWFVLSGYNHKNKSIFYEKRFCYVDDKNVSVLVGYSFEYPIEEKEKYNKWIKVFNASFDYPHSKIVEYKKVKLDWKRTGEHHDFEGYEVFSESFKESFEVLIFMNEEYSVLKYKDEFIPFDLDFYYDADVEDAIKWTKAFVSKESNTMYFLTEMPTQELPEYKVISLSHLQIPKNTRIKEI